MTRKNTLLTVLLFVGLINTSFSQFKSITEKQKHKTWWFFVFGCGKFQSR